MNQIITSRDNPVIKQTAALIKSTKERKQKKLFVCQGAKVLRQATENGVKLVHLLLTPAQAEKEGALYRDCVQKAIPVNCISPELAQKISDEKTPQGVFGICKSLDKVDELAMIVANGKYIAVENLQDPGNLGTIIRTALAFGIDGVIIAGESVDIYSPKVLRSTMGALFSCPLYFSQCLPETLRQLHEKGIKSYGAVLRPEAKQLGSFTFPAGSVAVIGNEGRGLSEETICACSDILFIPMKSGAIDSLNASIAAAAIMWEMCRPL